MDLEKGIKIYKKRWIMLSAAVLLTILSTFSLLSFGSMNNVIVSYFNINYATADWTILAAYVGGLAGLPLFTWFSYKEVISFNSLFIFLCITFIFNFVCIIISFLQPILFPFFLIGQFFGGLVKCSLSSLLVELAAVWFPEDQIALATSMVVVGWHIGVLLSNTIPENILKVPQTFDKAQLHHHVSNIVSKPMWYYIDRKMFILISVVILGLTFALFVFGFSIPKVPKQPPSRAQALKRATSEKPSSVSIKEFFQEIQILLNDATYLLIVLTMSVITQTFVIETLFTQQFVKPIFIHLNTVLNVSEISGYVLVCRSVGDVIGSIIAGKLLDRFKQYQGQIIVGNALSFLCLWGVFFSWYFSQLYGFCISMLLLGLLSSISTVALFDAMIQHTYPGNIMFVTSCAYFFRYCVTIFITELSRLIFFETSSEGVLLCYCTSYFLGFIFSLFIKVKLNRLQSKETNDSEISKIPELTPMLTNRDT